MYKYKGVYERAFNSLPGNIAVIPAPVKASRSYFSSYRGSPQTKVSGGSKGEPPLRNRIRYKGKYREQEEKYIFIVLYKNRDLWITPL